MPAGLVERQGAAVRRRPRSAWRRTLWRRPDSLGLAVAALAWSASLGPSQLPRPWSVQAVVSGICLALGYGAGVAGVAAVAAVGRRVEVRADPAVRRALVRTLAAVAAVLVGGGLVVWPVQQDAHRALVDLAPPSGLVVAPLVAGTGAVALGLVLTGRLLVRMAVVVDRWALRAVHRVVWRSAAAVALVAVLPLVSRDIVASGLVVWADDRFGALEVAATDRGVRPPRTPLVSGSAASLVPWDTLGYEGRRVAAGVTPVTALRRSAAPGEVVTAPVRVYVGERSAPSLQGRVALALRELERTGAFDREVLVIVATTGRGGVADEALRALEHLYAGDTAVVALQYGHLPSWVSYLVDREASAGATAALHQAVAERWAALPADDRPRLLVFGESLGAYGAEAAVAGRAEPTAPVALADGIEGTLLVGPTAANRVWADLDGRLSATADGRSVAVASGSAPLRHLRDRAERPALLYLSHPSDPVGSWALRTLWEPPAWTRPPNGPDVPDGTRWLPFVSWLHSVGDLVTASTVPAGHGHDYDREFLSAWTAVAPPDGWTDADHARLAGLLGVD